MAKWVLVLLVSVLSSSAFADFNEYYVCSSESYSVELWVDQADQSNQLVRVRKEGLDMVMKFNAQLTSQYPRSSWFDRVSGTMIEPGPIDLGISTAAGLNSGLRPGLPILQIYSPGLIGSEILGCRQQPLAQ